LSQADRPEAQGPAFDEGLIRAFGRSASASAKIDPALAPIAVRVQP
jgi:hypothetical protein